jgi:ABC-type Fe3+-hydroxamate transport system substrate-binding protein
MTYDDMGTPFTPRRPASRVVSLVPSLTESIATTRPEALVGATDWCTHPADLDIPRVRGTKNPNLEAIQDLRPDVVLANKEENRELDVRRLREAGIPVWVTVTESVPGALTALQRMFTHCLQWPAPDWLGEATRIWDGPPLPVRARTAIPIWRDPWMVVGSSTFTGDLVHRLGVENVFDTHPERYPQIDLSELHQAKLDFVLLPDEPYAFSPQDGPEAFPGTRTVLVSGRLLTWYGPSLVTAHEEPRAAMGLT